MRIYWIGPAIPHLWVQRRAIRDRIPHLWRRRCANRRNELRNSELLQEAQVGFVEEADVVDVVLQHRHALDAESPRVAVPLRGIDPSVAQHLRVDHAAAADLEPPLVPAALAPHAVADTARDVELEAGLCEGKVTRPH